MQCIDERIQARASAGTQRRMMRHANNMNICGVQNVQAALLKAKLVKRSESKSLPEIAEIEVTSRESETAWGRFM